jgi:hypothetical protein
MSKRHTEILLYVLVVPTKQAAFVILRWARRGRAVTFRNSAKNNNAFSTNRVRLIIDSKPTLEVLIS